MGLLCLGESCDFVGVLVFYSFFSAAFVIVRAFRYHGKRSGRRLIFWVLHIFVWGRSSLFVWMGGWMDERSF
jgi:hypothetical protein